MVHHLVVGAGGLLGSALSAQLREAVPSVFSISGLDWNSDHHVRDAFGRAINEFLRQSGNDQWVVHWCAGIATMRSNQRESERETSLLHSFFAILESQATRAQLSNASVTFASSAGGVYEHSPNPPHTELSEPRPSSPYGRAKLASERMLAEWCEPRGVRLTIGRIASLYGPSQNLSKPQGLLSKVIQSALTREPLSLFVPLGTTRNYIAADDAARLLLAQSNAERARRSVFNICSATNVSVAEVLRTAESLGRRRIPVRQSVSSRYEPASHDLRVASVWQSTVEACSRTSLRVGLHQLLCHQLRSMSVGAPRS